MPLLSVSAAADATQADSLSSKLWTVSPSRSGCTVKRVFAGKTPITVLVSRYHRGDRGDVILIGLEIPIPASQEYSIPISIRSDVSGREISKGTAFRKPAPATTAILNTSINALGKQLFQTGIGEGDSLIFSTRGQDILTVPADGFTTKGANIEECFAQVGQELLNARPDGESENSPPRGPLPRSSSANWIRTTDYRTRWLLEGLEGRVQFNLTVSRYGFVEKCKIAQSSGDERLDSGTCRLVKRRARFYPARGDTQQAIEGEWSGAVRWVIPE